MADENVNIKADNSQIKQAISEINQLLSDTQNKIDRVFRTSQDNNGLISNKQLAGVQNGFGRMYETRDQLQQQLDQINMNGQGSSQDAQQLETTIQQITQAIDNLRNSNEQNLKTITSSDTSSSSAFREDDQLGFTSQNAEDRAAFDQLRSDVRNLSSTLRRSDNNLQTGINAGYISHNRMQEYQGASRTQADRLKNLSEMLDSKDKKSVYGEFLARYNSTRQDAQLANEKANSEGATTKDVEYARALDEQVKVMDKMNEKYQDLIHSLNHNKDLLDNYNTDLDQTISGKNGTTIGSDPHSLKGIFQQRAFTIARGLTATAIGQGQSMINQGNNLRLNSFDNIKSVAYQNHISDNRAMEDLRHGGYAYGYNEAEMSGFVNAHTGSTGRVGSASDEASNARKWARMSRVTGGNAQTTQALEQAAGDATSLSANEMKDLGDKITNAITSSGMSGKGAEQQQGLAMLYQNGAAYGMTKQDEIQTAGLQASLSKYGSQFQGTLGAQTLMQVTQGLGNYNNPFMRQLFGQGDPRYTGQHGNALLMKDMQDMNKNPASMRRVLSAAEKAFGGDRLQTAAALSEQTGVPVETYEKLLKANDNGDLSKKTLEKYTKDNSQAQKNDRSYQKSGAATVQKNNAALANSAIKASQALDGLRKILADARNQHPIGSFFGDVASSTMGNVFGDVIGGLLERRLHLKPKEAKDAEKIFKDGNKTRKEIREARDSEKGLRGILKRTKGKAGKVVERGKGAIGRILGKSGRHAAPGVIDKLLGRSGKHFAEKGGKKLLGKIPFLGWALDAGVAGDDLKNGDYISAIDDTVGQYVDPFGMVPSVVGNKNKKNVNSMFSDLLHGRFGKLKKDAKKVEHGEGKGDRAHRTLLGSYYTDKNGKQHFRWFNYSGSAPRGRSARASVKVREASRSERSRVARHSVQPTTRKGIREAKRIGTLKKVGKYGALTTLGLGVGSLIYKGITGRASANRKKKKHDRNAKFSDSQDWKVLRGYNKMLDHAMRVVQAAKSIKDGGDSSNKDDGGSIGDESDLDKAAKKVAKKVGKKLDIDPKMIYAQEWQEMGPHMKSAPPYAAKYHNLAGIKWGNQKGAKEGTGGSDDGGNYADFDSWDSYADAYAQTLSGYASELKAAGSDYMKYAEVLKAHGYFTDPNVSGYAAGLKAGAEAYDSKATGGISARKFGVGSGMIASRATHGGSGDIYGEAGTEAYIPLNNSHYSSGLSALGDLAGLFGKKVVDAGETNQSQATTINPNYNINLTIQGGTDDPQALAQTVADKVREMLSNYDNQKAMQNEHAYFQNETSSQFI